MFQRQFFRMTVLTITFICVIGLAACRSEQSESEKIQITQQERNRKEATITESEAPKGFAEESGFSTVEEIVEYDSLHSFIENNPSYNDLNMRFPIEYVHHNRTNQQALYHTDNGWVLVDFGLDEKCSGFQRISVSEKAYLQDFENIAIGTSVFEITKLDPDADYDFLYASWTEYPKVSYHYTADGYRVTLYYDDNYCLTRIQSEIF